MENDLRKIFLIVLLTLSTLLGGCGMTKKLEQQSNEIDRLNSLLNEQYGTRAAEFDFAERQVGVYRGCIFLFNVCSAETTKVAQELIKKGFTGDSSPWWWAPFIGKLAAIGAFLGGLLWLPLHLCVRFTRPAKRKIDEAKKLIAGLDEKVNDANRKRTQTLQQNSAMKRELERLSTEINERKKQLAATDFAVSQAQANLNEAKVELQQVGRLKENFRKF